MDRIKLIFPTIEYESDILAAKKEFEETDPEIYRYAGCGAIDNFSSVSEWLTEMQKFCSAETCPEGKVPSTQYIAVRESDNRIVGFIDLRHHINHPVLSAWGGHIGYSVRPSERRKGYGREMLRLNLENCRSLGISRVMITCEKNNTASEKVIVACGGQYEKSIEVEGVIYKRFWISI